MLRRLAGSIALALVAMLLFNCVALAAWEFMFPTTITDTSSASRSYYPVMLGFGGQVLVDSSKISANGTNTNMQVGGADIKYMMSTTNITAVIPYLPASGMVTANLYTGYSPPQNGFPIVTGSGGYVTVADNSSMEPSPNFTMSMSGYVNTDSGATKNLVNKANAFKTYISGSGNITSIIYNATRIYYPGGTGNYTNIAGQNPGAGDHWDKVDDSAATPDDDATYVTTGNTVQEKDAYTLTGAIASAANITSVTVYYRMCPLIQPGTGQPFLRLAGAETAGATHFFGVAWENDSQTLARPIGGSWTAADFATLEVCIGMRTNVAGGELRCTQVYVVVNYDLPVTATGISSNVSTVKTVADSTNMTIYVNDVPKDSASLNGAVVPDTGDPWLFMQGNVMPYADNITLSVNGTQQLYLAPLVMITGVTVPDRSLQTHHGTITWGANSGLSISYGGMTSNESYTASSANATGGFDMPSAPMPSSWFAAGGNVSALPFYDSFVEVSVQTGTPVQTLYGLAIIGVAFGAFIGLVSFTRSALLGYIAMVIVFGIGSSMTIIPAWIVFSMVIVGAGIMYLYRQVAY
jgi:hypothetical protein